MGRSSCCFCLIADVFRQRVHNSIQWLVLLCKLTNNDKNRYEEHCNDQGNIIAYWTDGLVVELEQACDDNIDQLPGQ